MAVRPCQESSPTPKPISVSQSEIKLNAYAAKSSAQIIFPYLVFNLRWDPLSRLTMNDRAQRVPQLLAMHCGVAGWPVIQVPSARQSVSTDAPFRSWVWRRNGSRDYYAECRLTSGSPFLISLISKVTRS